MRLTPISLDCSTRYLQATGHQHVDRFRRHGADHRQYVFSAAQARRIEHVGTGLGKRLQAANGIGQIRMAVQEPRPARSV